MSGLISIDRMIFMRLGWEDQASRNLYRVLPLLLMPPLPIFMCLSAVAFLRTCAADTSARPRLGGLKNIHGRYEHHD